MNVELLWWEGCPSTERALEAVREALSELGLSGVEVHTREENLPRVEQLLAFGQDADQVPPVFG